MAAGALPARLKAQTAVRYPILAMEAGVTLQAEHPAFPSHQQHAIRTAVRIVADDAAFNPYSGMLVDIGAAFFYVALNAGLPVGGIEAGTIDAAVRVMTIRTLEESFRHPVMHWQGELCLDVSMAGKA